MIGLAGGLSPNITFIGTATQFDANVGSTHAEARLQGGVLYIGWTNASTNDMQINLTGTFNPSSLTQNSFIWF